MMSADYWDDYWDKCPFCTKSGLDKIESLEDTLQEQYNQMIAVNYDKYKENTQKQIEAIRQTLEDSVCFYNSFEFDEESGEYCFKISGQCQKCKCVWAQKGRIVAKR